MSASKRSRTQCKKYQIIDQEESPDQTYKENIMEKQFKLLVELGIRPKDELVSIINHVWAESCLDGPYIDMSGLQPKGVPELYPYPVGSSRSNIFSVQSHWGIATLPNGSQAPSVCDIKYDAERMAHCLGLSFRTEALDIAYQAYSSDLIEERPDWSWHAEIENWFRQIGESLYESFGFNVGTIGTETDRFSASELRRDGIPDDRRQALLIEEGQWVHWYPSTQSRPSEAIGTGLA